MSVLDRFFRPAYIKELRATKELVLAVEALEPTVSAQSDEDLSRTAVLLRQRFESGATLDDLLPESFAATREAAKRTLGLRHFDVQMVGGILLHRGKITEMRTGEGKTLVGTLPAALNACTGRGVHVVTVNDYLARRDAVWMGQVYTALGLTVGVINHDASFIYDPAHQDTDLSRDQEGAYKVHHEFLRPVDRTVAYAADITYGTNSEFGFDYLRDNIEFEPSRLRQRGHVYAIVDEIDSILIDEARTPLIISAPAQDSEKLYELFATIANDLHETEHFVIDEKLKSATLTDAGIEAAERMLGIENIYTDKGIKYVHHLETAVRAKALYQRDREYVVRDGEAVIVDEFTGRLQPGRRWSDGLHQAIEAKEGVTIQQESRTYASVTYQNYFRMYEKLAGMTGTALTSEEEFYTVYGLEVVPVPTNRSICRIDRNDLIFQTEKGKFSAVVRKIKEVHAKGQPILVGSASIDKNQLLSIELTKAGVPHAILNAKNHEHEGEIIAEAGRKGSVTLATNMAGRGVDIKLGGGKATPTEAEEVRALGGLFVLGTERHEARRIDNQLRGRSGRQGDPGETQFYVSMEDTLMRVFGGDRMKSLMGTFGIPEDQPIENGMLTKQLESAQTRIEGFHFDSRKQVLAYDDVLNKQRLVVYARRRKLLTGEHSEVDRVILEIHEARPETEEIVASLKTRISETEWYERMRRLVLQVTDVLWVEHLEVMSYTRASVNLRAYGQRDPLIEYRKEGIRLFKEMQYDILMRVADTLPYLESEAVKKEEAELHAAQQAAQKMSVGEARVANAPRINTETYGRNDMVTIVKDGEEQVLKYKKAEALLREGWQIKS